MQLYWVVHFLYVSVESYLVNVPSNNYFYKFVHVISTICNDVIKALTIISNLRRIKS